MARHVSSILCRRVSVDARTGAMSLFEVVEGLGLEKLAQANDDAEDVLPLEMSHVSIFVRSDPDVPEKLEGRLVLVRPNKKRARGTSFDIDLQDDFGCTSTIEIAALPIEGSGVYEFVTELKDGEGRWRQVASVPVLVEVTEIKPPVRQKKKGAAKKSVR